MSTVVPERAADSEPPAMAGRWFILFGLITAAIMEVLDTTIVNVALPQMAGNLGATREEIGLGQHFATSWRTSSCCR